MLSKVMVFGLAACLSAQAAQATVYAWKDEGGVWRLSNDSDAVPDVYRASAQKFTSKFANQNASVSVESAPPTTPISTPATLPMSAYERGLAQGLHTAERQVALAGELARTIVASAPRTPPIRIIIESPGPMIIREAFTDYNTLPLYRILSPYASFDWGLPYGYGYPYGFHRLVPHSHFFPTSRRGLRARRTGLFFSSSFRARQGEFFFPYGHFSHHGFLSGHGFVVR